jgi:hypothetical protein
MGRFHRLFTPPKPKRRTPSFPLVSEYPSHIPLTKKNIYNKQPSLTIINKEQKKMSFNTQTQPEPTANFKMEFEELDPVQQGKQEEQLYSHPPPVIPTQDSTTAPKTWRERLAFLYSRKFITILLLGQLLSLCITATTILTTKLTQGDNPVSIPTTQSFLNYLVLGIVYTGITFYKEGFRGWLQILRRRGIYCKFISFFLLLSVFEFSRNQDERQSMADQWGKIVYWFQEPSLPIITHVIQHHSRSPLSLFPKNRHCVCSD